MHFWIGPILFSSCGDHDRCSVAGCFNQGLLCFFNPVEEAEVRAASWPVLREEFAIWRRAERVWCGIPPVAPVGKELNFAAE